ncbi:MAG: sugar ABC transporter ATP-binding protein [Chloroflexota bacterium]|nr:MAG: sugar ABC transporter ATP-binding protein [Chloroflexota bacterium]
MSSNHAYLRMQGISKSFPGVQALKSVDFAVDRGEIHALVGENGAGKSTLMKILTGALLEDEGQIQLENQIVRINSPADAQQLGISMIHQELSLIPALTVGQNIFLGREPRSRTQVFIDWQELYKQAQALLDQLNVKVDSRANVQDLSIAQRQMVEVAKALSFNADLIAMDEPTSSLTDRETEILFQVMRSFKEKGISIIFISHRLEEVFEIADRITVLRDGEWISTNRIEELDVDQVVRMMVGRKLGELYPKDDIQQQEILLQATNLEDGRELRSVDISLKGGEILGIAGLAGAGRTALVETLFGVRPSVKGQIKIMGRVVRIQHPGHAIRLGMGFVPEDRKLQGLFLNMAVRENLVISALPEISRITFVDFSKAENLAREFVEKLKIRTPNLRQLIRNLSGGNQQKVIIARWLTLKPRILILDEPTRGIDVATKVEIHALMNQLAKDGVAVMMVSSDLPEVLGVSDRILVMRAGRIVAEYSRKEATQDKIMHAATSGRENHA